MPPGMRSNSGCQALEPIDATSNGHANRSAKAAAQYFKTFFTRRPRPLSCTMLRNVFHLQAALPKPHNAEKYISPTGHVPPAKHSCRPRSPSRTMLTNISHQLYNKCQIYLTCRPRSPTAVHTTANGTMNPTDQALRYARYTARSTLPSFLSSTLTILPTGSRNRV